MQWKCSSLNLLPEICFEKCSYLHSLCILILIEHEWLTNNESFFFFFLIICSCFWGLSFSSPLSHDLLSLQCNNYRLLSVENHNSDFRDKNASPQNSEMWSIIHFACMLNIIQYEHAGWHNDQGNCNSWKCAQDFHGSHPTETSLNAQFC